MSAVDEAAVLAGLTAEMRHVAPILRMSLGGAYAAARRGDIPTTRIGSRVLVLCAPLREKLGLPHPKAAA